VQRWPYSKTWFICPAAIFPGYVCVAAVLPDGLAITTEQDLRIRFDTHQDLAPQTLGDLWIDSREAAVLEVVSTVVKGEHNYLLNPAHPDFPRIAVDPPALFHFDARLFG
jgi:RES domain-containing protein